MGIGVEGRLMTSILEIKKTQTQPSGKYSGVSCGKKKMLLGNQKLLPSERQCRLCSLAHPCLSVCL